jgi:GT2 family glycosyltransferase
MSQDMHTVSIVIPTHNRCDALKRTLDALSNQDFPRPKMEVIVVLDGCEDATRTMLQNYAAPFRLISIEQQQAGPAAARNHGAAIATGWLLIFLDDDVVPTSRWLAAHVNGHFGKAYQVIIGYYPPAPHPELDYAAMTARAWWHDKFRDMQRPSHRFSYQDFLSGNCSMRSDLFASVGGFDHAFPCAHEDYELGLRLLNAGATFIFSAEAEASHYMLDTSTGARMLRRVRLEAQADVLISSRHPELRPLLPFVWFAESRTRLSRCMHYLAFSMPGVGDALAGLLCLLLRSYQWLQLRGRWHRNHMRLINYCYLRGLADALGTREAFVSLVQDSAPSGTQEKEDLEMPIDLSLGVEQAIQQVDQMRPMGVRILFGNQFIGRIAPKPGHEHLRGIHLRAMLATDLIWPLFMAILQKTAFDIKPFPPVDKPSIVAMRSEA